ncbi:hypothetical protein [Ornithinimicrobium sp. INDO-MA30-4]|uniref:hypothetical protein n=1 Tax=Ornithinimicrobium sp. INDO-MA30-4 TaxID=2908651 RepID=UPI001F2C5FE2|nr:hypothetical protein [Ornithinimicrobium sp. INDO-MA30-4]UJH69727.1 hypothetical protein L0A91_10445 [Ornithinimicrobium sp. INDO-MA30-4]
MSNNPTGTGTEVVPYVEPEAPQAPEGTSWLTVTYGLCTLFVAVLGAIALEWATGAFGFAFLPAVPLVGILAGTLIAFGVIALAIGGLSYLRSQSSPTGN